MKNTIVTSNEDFAKRMLLLTRQANEFEATAVYDPDGDCIEFLGRPDTFYAERVDELVTVYYSQESGEVVGALIKGVSRLCRELLERMPGFRSEVRDGRIDLEQILRARLWTSGSGGTDMATMVYRKLIEVAEASSVEIDGALLVS